MADAALAPEKVTLRRKILGVKIRHARTRAGLNVKEVGQALGLPAEMVSEIELGRRPVSLPQLEVMALIFNIPVMYFWSDETIKESNLNFPTKEAIALRQRIVGALLRKARIESGRSQEELANLLGVPVGKISDYEFGRAGIPVQELEALAEYLKVSLTYFIDEGIPAAAHDDENGRTPSLNEIADLSQLPREVREFLSNPANLLYVNIAMKLSELSADTLRALAEGLLEVTY
jgi:transcriptional regulator with XRE-family HTH domain